MGRKPNQLILEFFERGQKLEDASNRYSHTCKACGERFPKGRIDSLTTHLVRKCPAISIRDRQQALLRLNDLPELPVADPNRGGGGGGNGSGADARNVELPAGERNWTALETLAEVSRQVDLSEKHDGPPHANLASAQGGKGEEQALVDDFQLQEQWTPDNPPLSYEDRVQRDKKLMNQKLVAGRGRSSHTKSSGISMSPSMSPSLSMSNPASVAAATSRFIPAMVMVDPQLLGDDMHRQAQMAQSAMSLDPELAGSDISQLKFFNAQSSQDQQLAWPMLDGSRGNASYPDPEDLSNATTTTPTPNPIPLDTQPMDLAEIPTPSVYARPIAMNQHGMITEFSAEYGNGKRPARPKVRGRFNPIRRKEVQEVRKLGACLRCRMLKKPCSGESPCSTCRNVESARLWKQPCIRSRLADELDMYSAGLHAVLAYHDVNIIKGRVKISNCGTQIDTSHYPETTVYATFQALKPDDIPMSNDIGPSLGGNEDFVQEMRHVRLLDNDGDDLPMKIEAYMKRMMPVFIEKVPTHFMSTLLNTAMELAIQKQDPLLNRVLELWATVHILVDHDLRWSMSETSSLASESGHGIPINEHTNGESYNILHLQLNAAAEKKAAQISKSVLNDLERRLLQRSSTSSFETFLIALILLNCVEKSTWLFKSWEQESFSERWPLEKTPVCYSSQGDRVADMIQMLLRIRGIPPKTFKKIGDGILATDDEDPVAREFFEKLQLSYLDVLDKQMNPRFDPADSRCFELRFCSKLLLPTS